MAHYRVTVRYGTPRQQYHVVDLTADSLREAMIAAAEQMPDEATLPDLVEIRQHQDRAERELNDL